MIIMLGSVSKPPCFTVFDLIINSTSIHIQNRGQLVREARHHFPNITVARQLEDKLPLDKNINLLWHSRTRNCYIICIHIVICYSLQFVLRLQVNNIGTDKNTVPKKVQLSYSCTFQSYNFLQLFFLFTFYHKDMYVCIHNSKLSPHFIVDFYKKKQLPQRQKIKVQYSKYRLCTLCM